MGEAVYKKHIVHNSNEGGSLRTQICNYMSVKKPKKQQKLQTAVLME